MSEIEHFDVLVIGGGPGGTPAAMALAHGGKKVLLAVAGQGLGGACLFEGCIPSKIFRETAERRLEIGRAAEFGLTVNDPLPQMALEMRCGMAMTGNLRRMRAAVEPGDAFRRSEQ